MKRLCLLLIVIPLMIAPLLGCVLTTPFIKSVRDGNIQEAELLIKKGADINKKSFKGVTPLMEAVIWNNLSMVEFLLAKGADILAYEDDGYTALSYGVANGSKKEILERLIQSQDSAALMNSGSPIPVVSSLIRKAEKCMEVSDNYIIRISKIHGPNIWMDPFNRDFVINKPKPGVPFFDYETIAMIIMHEMTLDKLGYMARRKKYDMFTNPEKGGGGNPVGYLILMPVLIGGAGVDATKRVDEEIVANKMMSEYCEKCFGITKEKRKDIIKNINKMISKETFMDTHWAWVAYEEKMSKD